MTARSPDGIALQLCLHAPSSATADIWVCKRRVDDVARMRWCPCTYTGRAETEQLLVQDGDYIVRESARKTGDGMVGAQHFDQTRFVVSVQASTKVFHVVVNKVSLSASAETSNRDSGQQPRQRSATGTMVMLSCRLLNLAAGFLPPMRSLSRVCVCVSVCARARVFCLERARVLVHAHIH